MLNKLFRIAYVSMQDFISVQVKLSVGKNEKLLIFAKESDIVCTRQAKKHCSIGL